MDINEVKRCIANKLYVQFIDEGDAAYVPTCLSDDESLVYLDLNGASRSRNSATLDKIELSWPNN